jgi:hypothetical protein
LGKSNNFEFVGCNDIQEHVDSCNNMNQYSSAELVNFNNESLPYRPNSYQMIVNLYPWNKGNYNSPSLSEMERILTETGFLMIGVPSEIWNNTDMLNILQESVQLNLMSVQIIKNEDNDEYYLALLRKK